MIPISTVYVPSAINKTRMSYGFILEFPQEYSYTTRSQQYFYIEWPYRRAAIANIPEGVCG